MSPHRCIVLALGIVLLCACPALADAPPDDSANHGHMELTMIGQLGGQLSGLAISEDGRYAYVGQGPRIVAIDVSDPTHPVEVGRSEPIALTPAVTVGQIVPWGDELLVTAQDANGYWFTVELSIADAAQPVLLSEPVDGGWDRDRMRVAARDGAYATSWYECSHGYGVMCWGEGRLHWGTPDNTTQLFGGYRSQWGVSTDLTWTGTTLWVYKHCESEPSLSCIAAFDTTTPMTPAIIPGVDLQGYYDDYGSGSLQAQGDVLFASARDAILIIDASNSANPTLAYTMPCEVDGHITDMAADKDAGRLLWTDSSSLHVLDSTHYTYTHQIAQIPGHYVACAAKDDMVYAVTPSSLEIHNVSPNRECVKLGSYTHPLCTSAVLAHSENMVLVREGSRLQCIDVSRPDSLRIASTLDIEVEITDFCSDGQSVYLATDGWGAIKMLVYPDGRLGWESGHRSEDGLILDEINIVDSNVFVRTTDGQIACVTEWDRANGPTYGPAYQVPAELSLHRLHGNHAYVIRATDGDDPQASQYLKELAIYEINRDNAPQLIASQPLGHTDQTILNYPFLITRDYHDWQGWDPSHAPYYCVWDIRDPSSIMLRNINRIGSLGCDVGTSWIAFAQDDMMLFRTDLRGGHGYHTWSNGSQDLLAKIYDDGTIMVKGIAPIGFPVDVCDGARCYSIGTSFGLVIAQMTQVPSVTILAEIETPEEACYQIEWDPSASSCRCALTGQPFPGFDDPRDFLVWARARDTEPEGDWLWLGWDDCERFLFWETSPAVDRVPNTWFWQKLGIVRAYRTIPGSLSCLHPGAAIDCVVITDDPTYIPSDADIEPCTDGWPTMLPVVTK